MALPLSTHTLQPKNPTLLRDVNIPRERGQTRVLPDGSLLYREPLTDTEVPAVRLEDIRPRLVQEAAKKRSYRFPKKRGYDDTNVTAFVKKDYNFGPKRDNRPDRLFQIESDGSKGEKPDGYVMDEGRIVLDAFDHGLRNFGNQLPMYVSSELEGHDIEDYLRRNREIYVYDLVARAPNGYYKGKPAAKNSKTKEAREWHDGSPRVGTFSMRATRFRLSAGLLSWEKKDGSEAKNQRIRDVIPAQYKDPAVNSTKGWRDLNKAEIRRIKEGAMRKPQQARKEKRAAQAEKERAEKESPIEETVEEEDLLKEEESEYEDQEPWMSALQENDNGVSPEYDPEDFQDHTKEGTFPPSAYPPIGSNSLNDGHHPAYPRGDFNSSPAVSHHERNGMYNSGYTANTGPTMPDVYSSSDLHGPYGSSQQSQFSPHEVYNTPQPYLQRDKNSAMYDSLCEQYELGENLSRTPSTSNKFIPNSGAQERISADYAPESNYPINGPPQYQYSAYQPWQTLPSDQEPIKHPTSLHQPSEQAYPQQYPLSPNVISKRKRTESTTFAVPEEQHRTKRTKRSAKSSATQDENFKAYTPESDTQSHGPLGYQSSPYESRQVFPLPQKPLQYKAPLPQPTEPAYPQQQLPPSLITSGKRKRIETITFAQPEDTHPTKRAKRSTKNPEKQDEDFEDYAAESNYEESNYPINEPLGYQPSAYEPWQILPSGQEPLQQSTTLPQPTQPVYPQQRHPPSPKLHSKRKRTESTTFAQPEESHPKKRVKRRTSTKTPITAVDDNISMQSASEAYISPHNTSAENPAQVNWDTDAQDPPFAQSGEMFSNGSPHNTSAENPALNPALGTWDTDAQAPFAESDEDFYGFASDAPPFPDMDPWDGYGLPVEL